LRGLQCARRPGSIIPANLSTRRCLDIARWLLLNGFASRPTTPQTRAGNAPQRIV
jgi:hypothetical protein